MRKIVLNLIFLVFLLFALILIILATSGFETDKFNKLISEKVIQSNKDIYLELNKIKFKIDPKNFNLFLETHNPKINYQKVSIPIKNVRVYMEFISLLKSKPKIKKINIALNELDISELNKLSQFIKPSNLKSFLNHKIREGKLNSEIEIFLNNERLFENFIAKGSVKKLKAELVEGFYLTDTNFNFFADSSDILIKKLSSRIEEIKIFDGDIKLNLDNGVNLATNFESKIDLKKEFFNKNKKFFNKIKFFDFSNLKADLNNNFQINFDNTYKVTDYKYGVSGKITKSKILFREPIKNQLIEDEIKTIYISDSFIETNLNPKNKKFFLKGKYSFDNLDFLNINLENEINKRVSNLQLNLDFRNSFKIDIINYLKPKKKIANLYLDLNKTKNIFNIKKLKYKNENDEIEASNLKFKDNKFQSFKKVSVKTFNNNFSIENKDKILIKGSNFDATKIAKFFSKNEGNVLNEITNNIEIDFKNILVPMSEKLENFKLIGEIKNGKFIKISSKGDFGGKNYLDISMKSENNIKYLEIFSDLTRPLLTEYSFFNGLTGGKLLYTSSIEELKSKSKLKIENFKVINASGIVKLLSLADLSGLADLAEGEGLTFDVLEIDMEKNKDLLTLKEILALGPSLSVLMEGYQDKNGLVSLRGTLVPAKTLNKIISKIPIIGNIVIPKEVGEGLFGVSFKMKGPKGKIKTTINPIRTLTPRFIQKIVDKNRASK